jgi:hypothetical protein
VSRKAYDAIRRVSPAIVELRHDQFATVQLVVPETGARWQPIVEQLQRREWQHADALDAGRRILATWTPADLGILPTMISAAAPAASAAPAGAATGAAPAAPATGAGFSLADVMDAQFRTLQLLQSATAQRDQALLHLVKLSVERSDKVEQSVQRLVGALERQAVRHSRQMGEIETVSDDDDSGPSLMELGAQLLPALLGSGQPQEPETPTAEG